MQVGKLKKGMQKFLKMADIFPRNLEMFTFWSYTIYVALQQHQGGKMISFCEERHIPITAIVKPGCKHHPHSPEDVTPIPEFVEG